jgi:Fe-S-cluster containining protein
MLKQFVPSEFCLKCDVCCRFGEKNSPYAPKFLAEEAQRLFDGDRFKPDNNFPGNLSPSPIASTNAAYVCQFFSPLTNTCSIYSQRPFDCQLYPFILCYDKKYQYINLCLDNHCPFPPHPSPSPLWGEGRGEGEKYAAYLLEYLNSDTTIETLSKNHSFIMPHQPDAVVLARLDKLSDRICKTPLGFHKLSLEHKPLFDEYLNPILGTGSGQTTNFRGTCPHRQLSTRSFANIYIWSDLFNILWKIIGDSLCVFYEYKDEFNMLLPPIPHPSLRGVSPPKVAGRRTHMGTSCNQTTAFLKAGCPHRMAARDEGPFDKGRIENIAKEEIDALKSCGIKIYKNTDEYIYLAEDIAQLKGNKFASHRAALNHFVKNNKFIYRPFKIDDIDDCLSLYIRWANQRKRKMGTVPTQTVNIHEGTVPIFQDKVYAQLLDDSFYAGRKAMMDYEELGLIGRIVEIENKICAYTFAFKMAADTYCVVFETTDTSIKGLSQFVFSRLAQELCGLGAKYLNAMDDSGLENLRRVKLSWRPHKIISNYIGIV